MGDNVFFFLGGGGGVGWGKAQPTHVSVPKLSLAQHKIWQNIRLQSLPSVTLRRLKDYRRSTVKQDRLNNCLLMHDCHKSITDTGHC